VQKDDGFRKGDGLVARIFVIDDDEQLLDMVGLMLERGGHHTTLLTSAIEGWEQITSDKPDLLVLDVMMPDMSGHDLTRQIRANKELEDLPILILTARSQEIDRTTALKIGADDYLSKPVTARELIERVDKLLTAKKGEETPTEEKVVIAFYGLRGGVGQTTLAVNLAAALRRLSQQEVCLVDLSPTGSQSLIHMRLQAHSSWADLATANGLDWPALQDRLSIHPSGLRVLAAPPTPQAPTQPAAETTSAMIELLRDYMTFVVLDLPPVLSPAFQAALEAADVALHVISPDVVSVQTAVKLSRSLVKVGVTFRQKSYILNQVSAAEAQLAKATVERGLNAKVAFQIRHDPNQTRALAQGVPLTLTSAKSPLPIAMKRMSEVIWQRVTKKNAK
jgi:pilus assembly protein CpaE